MTICSRHLGGYTCTRKAGHQSRWCIDKIRRGTWIPRQGGVVRVITSRTALAAAFNEWAQRYEADPDSFDGIGGETYGDNCADYLLDLLAEVAS